MTPGAAPLSMKIIPLRWRGAGVGCPQPEDPPRRLTPSAPPRRGFSWEVTRIAGHAQLFRGVGIPPPKARGSLGSPSSQRLVLAENLIVFVESYFQGLSSESEFEIGFVASNHNAS